MFDRRICWTDCWSVSSCCASYCCCFDLPKMQEGSKACRWTLESCYVFLNSVSLKWRRMILRQRNEWFWTSIRHQTSTSRFCFDLKCLISVLLSCYINWWFYYSIRIGDCIYFNFQVSLIFQCKRLNSQKRFFHFCLNHVLNFQDVIL